MLQQTNNKYWEIGNENYGSWEWWYRIDQTLNKNGQPEFITGALYEQQFKIFVDSMQRATTEIGKKIYIGAVRTGVKKALLNY